MINCENCAKQYTCKITGQNQCESFKSWRETKNYGVPRRIENVLSNEIQKR